MEQTEWGILVVNYLFLAGVSAGAFAISSFATYIGGRTFAASLESARSSHPGP